MLLALIVRGPWLPQSADATLPSSGLSWLTYHSARPTPVQQGPGIDEPRKTTLRQATGVLLQRRVAAKPSCDSLKPRIKGRKTGGLGSRP
ncbi:hypothetical protein CABS01_14595 [Colletotrichum abscissum]|uniref:uncharacterized protein n=1 Tax=Colletotrichum abscissum TaxID=1671311 RepID=UPI0027D56765|nr:uncharacterized protein CABS01_14595 [Colletotrichum abscissum]KAK1478911.1 hypothetical protein CABS01_14595 [Colletotrichum abscissum]